MLIQSLVSWFGCDWFGFAHLLLHCPPVDGCCKAVMCPSESKQRGGKAGRRDFITLWTPSRSAGPGRQILVSGFHSLCNNRPDMNTLVGLGATSSFAVSCVAAAMPRLGWTTFFEEPAMLLGELKHEFPFEIIGLTKRACWIQRGGRTCRAARVPCAFCLGVTCVPGSWSC